MKLHFFQVVLHPFLFGVFLTLIDAKGTFYGSPYRYNLYKSGSSPHYTPGKPMGRHKNYCAYVVQRNISCTIQDGTATYVKAEYSKCTWGQKCPIVMYRTFYKPKYKVGYKAVTELEWRCCPGYSGEGCHEGPTSLPEMMPPFMGSMTPPGFKGQPWGHPRVPPDQKTVPTGHLEPLKPFPVGQPEQKSVPSGHIPPGHKKSYYARKLTGVLGERLDRMEEELRRLSQGFDTLHGMVTGLEDSLRLSLREDTNKMLGSLLSSPPHHSDSTVGFGVIPDGNPDGLEGGEGFPGFGDLAGKVTEVKDELRIKSEMLDELHGMVLGHDGQLKHLLESDTGRPSPLTSQKILEELIDTKLAGIRAEILDGFEKRLSGLQNHCEARIGEVQRQCHQEQLNGQEMIQHSLDGRETGLRKELGNLQAQIQGLTLTESCCGQVSSLSNRVLLIEESLKGLTESHRELQPILDAHSTIIGNVSDRVEMLDIRLSAVEREWVDSKFEGQKTCSKRLEDIEARLNSTEVTLSKNTTDPPLLEGLEIPTLETDLEAIRRQLEGELSGMQNQLSHLEILCSSACPKASGMVEKLQTEMEECKDTEKKVSGQLDAHTDDLNKLNSTLQQVLNRLVKMEGEDSIQGEITLLKINFNSVNRTVKGLKDSVGLFAQEVSQANSTWQQHELWLTDQVHGIQQLVGQQGSQLGLSERRLHQLKGELQTLKRRLAGELQGCKSTALNVQREFSVVDGRVTQVEGLCGNLGGLADDLERIRGELESHSNSYLSQVKGTLSTHSHQLAELKDGLKDCLNKTGEAGQNGNH
uniref:Elastin microfibril interfacer 3 n=1 Tax=Lepisosteus oculatus TaxID=7918 RepID=W5MBH6_LEPOC|nr:PREDICTED: EMILIN-3 isoform X1 [Lepisosteus oculatus]